ncbi:MAG: hypothetical protein DMG21_12045, partial [Acidobacteria bacterium]
KSKAGYCEYFAAAMAVMLRTVGIPTRIVNGFQTGVYNALGHDYVVRARDAHSWVEVYFNGFGWIPFDPTPPDPNETGAAWGALDDYLDAASLFWSEWIINYDFSRQVELARDVEQQSRFFHEAINRRFLKVLGKKGHRKFPAQTPREFAATLAASPLGARAEEFTSLYNSVRFGAEAAPLPRLRELLDQLSRS